MEGACGRVSTNTKEVTRSGCEVETAGVEMIRSEQDFNDPHYQLFE
jgi:hypothetical protein